MPAGASRHRILVDPIEGKECAQGRVDPRFGGESERNKSGHPQPLADCVERARVRSHPREGLAVADAEVEVPLLALRLVRRDARIERFRDDVHGGEGVGWNGLRPEPRRRCLEQDPQDPLVAGKLDALDSRAASETEVDDALGTDGDPFRLLYQDVQRGERRMSAESHFGQRREPAQVEVGSRVAPRRDGERRLAMLQLRGDALHLFGGKGGAVEDDTGGVPPESPVGKGVHDVARQFHTPLASAPQMILCICNCKRAGRSEARSQRARSFGATSPKLGEKRTGTRPQRPRRSMTDTAQRKSASPHTTTLSSSPSPSASSSRKSRCCSPDPGVLRSTIFFTPRGIWSSGLCPCVSRETSYPRARSSRQRSGSSRCRVGSPPVRQTKRAGCRSTSARVSAKGRAFPPWNAYSVSQYPQRRSQPVKRTKTHGFPAWVDSPWMLKKISVTLTRAIYSVERPCATPARRVNPRTRARERRATRCAARWRKPPDGRSVRWSRYRAGRPRDGRSAPPARRGGIPTSGPPARAGRGKGASASRCGTRPGRRSRLRPRGRPPVLETLP